MGFFGSIMDRLTLGFFRLFSGRLRKKLREAQLEHNRGVWEKEAPERFIEHQNRMRDLSYGHAGALSRKLFFGGRKLSAADNACEVIAVYNALLVLGEEADFPQLLFDFSCRGICFGGVFGTNPAALVRYLKKRGLQTETVRGGRIRAERLRELENGYEVFIFTAFNRGRNPFHMIHTMCVTREGDQWQVHNDCGCRGASGLEDAVLNYNDGKGHPICVIGIRK